MHAAILTPALVLLLGACQQPPGEPSRTSDAQESAPRSAAAPTAAKPAPTPELSPRQRDARGDELLKARRFREALADFDAFLEAFPNQAPHHWRRGIACYYAGAFAEGVAQFESHRIVNPDDVENAVWHFLCKARLDGVPAARAAILPVGPDARAPLPEIYALFAGTGTVAQVEARMNAVDTLSARFYGHLYLGLYEEALGNLDAAKAHMERAAGPDRIPHYMGDIAVVHARVLAER